MTLKSTTASLLNALVLLGCALFAGADAYAVAFAIGDGGNKGGVLADAEFFSLLVGTTGLLVAALGSLSRLRSMSVIAFLSIVLVLPQVMLSGWNQAHNFYADRGLWADPSWETWTLSFLPTFLCLAGAAVSLTRFQEKS